MLAERPWLAYLFVFIGVCGHASSEFVSKLAPVSGPEVSVWRYLLGGAGLIVIALALKGSRDLFTPLRESGFKITWLSLIGMSGGYLFFHWSLDFASVIQVATVVTAMPIFVGMVNLWLNGETMSPAKVATGVAAVTGVAILVTDGYLDRLAGDASSLIGIAMAMACAFLGGAYTVLAKPLIQRYGAIRLTAISMFIGGLGLWVIVGAFFAIWVNPFTLFERPPSAYWPLIVIALWNTTITQLFWFAGLAAAPDITRASYLFFLKPVIAAALALLFIAGAEITVMQALAILVICGAVALEAAWPAPKKTR